MTIHQLTCIKDPSSVEDFGFTWTTWLNGDTIATSAWSVPSGITQNSASNTTTATTIWLSSGTVGQDYEIYNTIVTAGGRTERALLKILVR